MQRGEIIGQPLLVVGQLDVDRFAQQVLELVQGRCHPVRSVVPAADSGEVAASVHAVDVYAVAREVSPAAEVLAVAEDDRPAANAERAAHKLPEDRVAAAL